VETAFGIAKTQGKMEIFASVLGKKGSKADYTSIAKHYEVNESNKLQAGRFYLLADDFEKALDLLLVVEDAENRHIDLAIEVVGAARMEKLTHRLIDYVMGEADGNPKDAKYLFKLYIALKQFPEAARTAVIIAKEEQVHGNYRNAHGVLLQMHNTLMAQDIRIPSDLWRNLMLLHSYIIVKIHMKRNENVLAARMLLRVSDVISAFPEHVVNILTSTVVACWKAGLKAEGTQYAAMLMRPEYRKQVDPKYIDKITKIVRKPDKSTLPEELSQSPYTTMPEGMIPSTNLDCPVTQNHIPYCIVTGQHMVLEDWSVCPKCSFPALYSHFTALLQTETSCPMCGEDLSPDQIKKVDDPSSLLRKFKMLTNSDSSEA